MKGPPYDRHDCTTDLYRLDADSGAQLRHLPAAAGTHRRKKAANHWERGKPVDDPEFLVRAKAAHLNCLENLPLFAALVLIGATTDQSATVNAVAGIIVAARIGQSLAHLIGTSFPLVFIRASLFLTQVALMLYLAFALI